MNQIILEAGQRIAEVVRRLRQLKSVELKSYVSDIPIQMIDLDIPVGKEK
jgi:intergrase/recombinase